ncbi:MAG TPA: sulfatase-like hydrolase/transferase [Saprospiraceae bacterium]|nr:sulfatase-like hydrolase/transferase [Saprospiraceae bacterium]
MQKLNLILSTLLFSGLFAFSACSEEAEMTINNVESPNILLIIADDLGKDAINGYQEGVLKPVTPNINALQSNGLTFQNFWVNPTCTPTRAAIITGKYGYHTGVLSAGDILSPSEVSLQKYLRENTNQKYATAVVGKWHLSGNQASTNPESFGMDYYAGLIRGAVDDYYRWQLTEDGASSLQTQYISETFTDLSIDWINAQTKPWFLWLAYNAPHTPFHTPPENMHSQGNLATYANGMDPLPYYLAAIEAMDFQIGRLLENIPQAERERTLIIFIGDNGTPGNAAQTPYASNTTKGTLFQGGINVPMFISGKGLNRQGIEDNLITGTDLFATISEIAGLDLPQIHDSKSFKSLLSQPSVIRGFQYAETNNSWTIRNQQYKLIIDDNSTEVMYDLINDPYEQNNLLDASLTNEEANALEALNAKLLEIRN